MQITEMLYLCIVERNKRHRVLGTPYYVIVKRA